MPSSASSTRAPGNAVGATARGSLARLRARARDSRRRSRSRAPAESGGTRCRGPRSLDTSSAPNSIVASRREIDRPSPTPPKRRVSELSAWPNGAKIFSWSCAAMPMPVSRTAKHTLCGESRPTQSETLPCSVNFKRVLQQIREHLAQADGVGLDHLGTARRRSRSGTRGPSRARRSRSGPRRPRPGVAGGTGWRWTSRSPASTREMSRMPSISWSRSAPLRRTAALHSARSLRRPGRRAGAPCSRARRSSACGSRDSCSRETRSSRGSPTRRGRWRPPARRAGAHGGRVLLEAARHLVHGARELAHLVAARDRHARREVAVSDALRGAQQLTHRLHERARQEQAGPERAQAARARPPHPGARASAGARRAPSRGVTRRAARSCRPSAPGNAMESGCARRLAPAPPSRRRAATSRSRWPRRSAGARRSGRRSRRRCRCPRSPARTAGPSPRPAATPSRRARGDRVTRRPPRRPRARERPGTGCRAAPRLCCRSAA